jgi:hypothetical protein
MRSHAALAITAFLLTSTALVSVVEAAPKGGAGGGGPAPRAAPAAHAAAPAAHVAAPRVAAPRPPAPGPRMAAPHAAAPRVVPLAARQSSQRTHVATPHSPPVASPHVAPTVSSSVQRAGNHSIAPSAAQGRDRGNQPTDAQAASHRITGQGAGPGKPGLNGQAPTVTGGNRDSNANRAMRAGPQMQGGAQRTPILRNPAFASGSSRNPQMPSFAQSTFRGGFAQSGFAGQRSGGQRRSFGSVLGFVGPLFWPYAYSDFVEYTFSPYAYDTFWPYAYDDLYQGIYGVYAPQYYANEDAYAYAGTSASGETYANATGTSRQRGRRAASTAGSTLICSSQAEGLTAFPIDRIAQQVELDQTQQALLQDLKAATASAVGILQAACPNELPSTPTGRLSAMRARVGAMLQTVQAVRPALERFYDSLSDEQKERFTAAAQRNPSRQQQDLAGLCGGGVAQSSGLSIERVERELRLSEDQGAALRDLNESSAKSAEIMKTNCQPDQTLTATGRLAAMEKRLTAMLHGLDQVQPALMKFYASLNDEQKARFDRLGIRPG